MVINMKKILIICFLLTFLLFVIGCQKVAEEAMEAQIESETGQDAEVDIGKGKMTVETPEGTIEIEGSDVNSDEWCQEGAEWKFTSTTPQAGGVNAQWTINGLIETGEFAGLCHVEYTAESSEGDAKMDYYFSEDGESGYFEMEVNDQKIKQEWHK